MTAIRKKGGIFLNSNELKRRALETLKGHWGYPILVCLIGELLTGGLFHYNTNHLPNYIVNHLPHYGFYNYPNINFSFNGSWLLDLILGGPIAFGLCFFFLNFVRSNSEKIEDLFAGFKFFGNTFVLNLVMSIFIFLWSLLLIVPGIIAAISYSMSFYILCDNPDMDAMEALRQSKELMEGNKEAFFSFWLSFLGWFILSVATCGIGFLFSIPYYRTAKTNFYLQLKYENYNNSNNY